MEGKGTMDLKAIIEKRGTVRQFSNDSINPDDLREMVRRAGLAPSVNNSQPWRFIAITNKDLLKTMADEIHAKVSSMLPDPDDETGKRAKSEVAWFCTFFTEAPAVIAVASCPYEAVVDKALSGSGLTHDQINEMRNRPDIQSLGASIENLILTAVDLGYGACWMSGPLVARDRLEKELNVSEPWRLAAMVAIGRPAAAMKQKEKKPLDAIFELRD
jgi:nitroreductase